MATSFFGGEFFGGEFFFGGAPAVTPGGHFLPRKKRKQEKQAASAREKLRAQILEAIDGPPELAAIVAPYVEPEVPEAPWRAPEYRIDWDRLYRDFNRVERDLLQAIEDDDDEDWLLLNG